MGDDDLSRLQQELAQCQQDRTRDREDFETKMQDIRQKTKDHMTKFQDKMQTIIQQKDSQLEELKSANEEALAEVASLKSGHSDSTADTTAETERANAAEAKLLVLEQEIASLKEKLRAQEENGNAAPAQAGDEDERLKACMHELQEARSQRDEAQVDAQMQIEAAETLKIQLAELQEEFDKSRQDTQAKVGEVVEKAKQHVKQVQVKLEAQISENKQLQANFDAKESENKDLLQKFREVDDAYAQQQEKVNKYKQLMAQANARIEDGDESTREFRENFEKLKAEHEKLKELHEAAQKASTPPSREEVADAGGILLTVEAENDDVWCLLAGNDNNDVSGDDPSGLLVRRRWWLSSQLDVDDKPIPLQRRWKGEVVALRAQTTRANKQRQDLQEEFEAYRQKANAALQTGAAHSQDILASERKFEQLGQQLQVTTTELHQAQSERSKILEDLCDVRRRLQEATSQKSEVERMLDLRARESQLAQDAAVAECKSVHESEKESASQKWREKERTYLQELDLHRAQKESLKEEIEGLRTRLASRPAIAEPISPAYSQSRQSAVGSNHDGTHSSLISRSADMSAPAAERLGSSPLDEGRWRSRPAAESPRPSPRSSAPSASAPSQAGPSAQQLSRRPSSASTATDSQALVLNSSGPGGDDSVGQVMTSQGGYSLQASAARQDIMALRAQVRQLEATVLEQKHRHASLEKEKETLQTEVREVQEEQRLQKVVGQHQQMEYIRNVFRKFVETLPTGQAEHEQLIPVLMTFFQFAPDETRAIQSKRPPQAQGLLRSFGWGS